MTKAGHKTSGFTLIELLVVLGIMGTLLVILFGGLRFGHRAWERSLDQTESIAEYQSFYRITNDWISRMYPMVSDITGQNEYVFLGERSRVRFTTFMPAYPTRGGLYLVEFAVEDTVTLEGERQQQVVLYRQMYNGAEDFQNNFDPENRTVLIRSVEGDVALEYYGSARPEQQNVWSSSWQEVERFPDMIKFKFLNDRGEGWPDMVIPVRVTMDGSCLAPEMPPVSLCRNAEVMSTEQPTN